MEGRRKGEGLAFHRRGHRDSHAVPVDDVEVAGAGILGRRPQYVPLPAVPLRRLSPVVLDVRPARQLQVTPGARSFGRTRDPKPV